MIIYLKNKHTLQVDNFYFNCSIGMGGIIKKKIEGDKKTPIGKFDIGHLYYRKDRIKKPKTHLNCISIKKNIPKAQMALLKFVILIYLFLVLKV